MNRKQRRLVAVFAIATLVMLATMLAGSANALRAEPNAGSTKKILTFVYAPRGFNDATKAWANGMDRAAKQLGNAFRVEEKGTSALELDPGAYLRFIQQALVEKPAGIVVAPNLGPAMKAGLNAIAAGGTKVLIMDAPIPGMKSKVAFVGTDNYGAGTVAAKWMVDQYKSHKLKSNEIAVLESPPGYSPTNDRADGFKAGIKGSGLKIVADLAPGLDAVKARSAMADALTAHPNLAGVFTATDIIALGAAPTLVAEKRTDVQLISVDGTANGVGLIVQKKGISAEVAQHLEEAGYLSVMTLAKAIEGKKVASNVYTGITLVTSSNAKAYLKKAKAEARG